MCGREALFGVGEHEYDRLRVSRAGGGGVSMVGRVDSPTLSRQVWLETMLHSGCTSLFTISKVFFVLFLFFKCGDTMNCFLRWMVVFSVTTVFPSGLNFY